MDYSRLITTTSQSVAPYVVDAVHQSSVWVGRQTARVTPWTMGIYHKVPVQVKELTTAIDFRGQGNFNTADNSTDVNFQWEIKGLGDSVIVSWTELGLNQTKAQVIDLVKRKMDVVKNSLIAAASSRFYGLGTGDSIEGLQLSTDNSTYSSSYGGVSRASYGAYINGQVTPAAGGLISFASVAAQIDLCSASASTTEATTLIMSTKSIWGYLERLMETKSRGNYDTVRGALRVSPYTPMGTAVDPSDVGRMGYEAMYFRGIPAVKDDATPTGLCYTLCESKIGFVSSKIAYCDNIDMKQTVTKGALENIVTTAWQRGQEAKPTNGMATIYQIAINGNEVNENPRRSGVITGITGI